MPIDRIRKFESLKGWDWDREFLEFKLQIPFLESYVARESHARVPHAHIENDFKLGFFVAQQRNRFKKGTLSEEKQKILESFSGWVWAPKSKSTR